MASDTQPDNQRLRLVQFNVENLFLFLDLYKGQDLRKITESEWKHLSTSTTLNKPLRKVWALAQILREVDADIVMLNEVGGEESLENFNRYFLDSQYIPLLKEGNSLRGIDVGYLVKKDLPFKTVLLSHKNRPIGFLYPHESQTPAGGKSHYFSRDVAELRLFRPGQTSPHLVVLLTHLKSKLDADRVDIEGRKRRAAELLCLTAIYNELKEELGPSAPILVCGDMNGIASRTNTEAEFAPLYEHTDLIEALEAVNVAENERYTQVQISPQGKQHLVQIDYVFVSPALKDRIVKDQTYVYRFKDPSGARAPVPRNLEERGAHASDHYPVVVTLDFK